MKLKDIRLRLQITQQAASKLLGVPLRTYKRYEIEESYQKLYKYKWMCEVLANNDSLEKRAYQTINHNPYNITIAGCGYVGLSLACLLSSHSNIIITDILQNKVDLINSGKSPFSDSLVEKCLPNNSKIKAEISKESSYRNSDFVIIATPTDFNLDTNTFDTSSIENVINLVRKVNKQAIIIIRSTVPLGYTEKIKNNYHDKKIIFSPEFLREGKALFDNYYPSRIIVGCDSKTEKSARKFASFLLESSHKKDVPILLMSNTEAEAVKLFSNTYLAMRVAYFNELDTYAEINKCSSANIVKGICLDPRIGDFYNNPSFGYGGYCLPKDTAQVANSFLNMPNSELIKSIVISNVTRKEFITRSIIEKAILASKKSIKELTIGVYLLSMKNDSDNHRFSSTIDIVKILKSKGVHIIIYDSSYAEGEKNFDKFIIECDYYIANRYSNKLKAIKKILYTRDLFNRD